MQDLVPCNNVEMFLVKVTRFARLANLLFQFTEFSQVKLQRIS